MTDEKQTSSLESEEQLRLAIAEYEKQLAQITQLVAHVRHEINNPLTGVLGQAQLLLREELSEKARKRVKTIEELSIRMRDIVAELRLVQKPAKPDEKDDTASPAVE